MPPPLISPGTPLGDIGEPDIPGTPAGTPPVIIAGPRRPEDLAGRLVHRVVIRGDLRAVLDATDDHDDDAGRT